MVLVYYYNQPQVFFNKIPDTLFEEPNQVHAPENINTIPDVVTCTVILLEVALIFVSIKLGKNLKNLPFCYLKGWVD